MSGKGELRSIDKSVKIDCRGLKRGLGDYNCCLNCRRPYRSAKLPKGRADKTELRKNGPHMYDSPPGERVS